MFKFWQKHVLRQDILQLNNTFLLLTVNLNLTELRKIRAILFYSLPLFSQAVLQLWSLKMGHWLFCCDPVVLTWFLGLWGPECCWFSVPPGSCLHSFGETQQGPVSVADSSVFIYLCVSWDWMLYHLQLPSALNVERCCQLGNNTILFQFQHDVGKWESKYVLI